MSAYEILEIIMLALLLPIGIYAIWGRENRARDATRVIAVVLLICLAIGLIGLFGMSFNKDRVVELRVWRQMVAAGEFEVYDDVGHLTYEATEYNIEVALMQEGIKKHGRWSQYYGTGAETLLPITKEDKNA